MYQVDFTSSLADTHEKAPTLSPAKLLVSSEADVSTMDISLE